MAQASEMTPEQRAAEHKANKTADWLQAAEERSQTRGTPAPSEPQLRLVYDLVRRTGVNDQLRKEVYTALKFGASRKQVSYFIDVLLGKADWSPRDSENSNDTEPAEEIAELAAVGAGYEDSFGEDADFDSLPF